MERPLHIAIFCMGSLGGSTEVAVVLAQSMRRRGHTCDIFAYSDSYRERLFIHDIAVMTPMPMQYAIFENIATDFGLLIQFAERHQQRPYDLIHAHYAIPIVHIISNLQTVYGLPAVMTFHGSDASILPRQMPLGFVGKMMRVTGMEVTAASEFLARQVHEEYDIPFESIHHIRNSVAPEFFEPYSPDTPAEPYFLHCSNLRALKRPGDIIEAMGMLENRRVRLKIIGEGPDLPALRVLANAKGLAGRVEFLGRIDDRRTLAGMMAGALGVIQSSEMESQPLTVLEAMAVGAPAICADFPSVYEIIGENAERGSIYPIGDVPALAEILAGIVADPEPARQKAEIAGAFVREQHSLDAIVDQYLRLYRRMVPANCCAGQ